MIEDDCYFLGVLYGYQLDVMGMGASLLALAKSTYYKLTSGRSTELPVKL